MNSQSTAGQLGDARALAPVTPGRLPWEPLARLLRVSLDTADYAAVPVLTEDHGLWCDATAARALNTSRRQVLRWKAEGLTPAAADRCATQLKLHALEIWGNAWTCVEIGACVRRQARRRGDTRHVAPAPTAGQRVDAAVRRVLIRQRALIRRTASYVVEATDRSVSTSDHLRLVGNAVRSPVDLESLERAV
jgi:hypothetical protein